MQNKKIIVTTITTTFFCALFALIFFGIKCNDLNRPPVYLVTLGFTGAFTRALLKLERTRDVIYLNILVFFVFTIVMLKTMPPITILIFFIYFSTLFAAIFIYERFFEKKINHVPMARTLLLAALVGLFYVGANFIHGLFFISQFKTQFLLGNLPVGFLIGFGIGLGQEINEKYFNKIEP